MNCVVALFAFYVAVARAQQVGTLTTETHPPLPWQKCTKSGGCVTQSSGKVVLDANWRWLHSTSSATNCYTGQTWNTQLCPDAATCAQNCAVDGADYSGTYGITTSGNALTLKFVTKGANTNVGSRVYLMASDNTNYEMFKLKNQEFTFDVDVSNLPCGLNGALYFSEMAADGGKSKYTSNKAGAKYGTGYCDAQCPRDIKFVNGEANVKGWTGSTTDSNSGKGDFGSCCNEMDIWEANSIATAYTPHPCTVVGQTRCTGTQCADYCDQPGCDFNSFRMGDRSFYGKGLTVDTSKKMTVVTQFVTDTNTASGKLVEIRRVYVQDGKVIQNSKVNVPGMTAYDSITDQFCEAQKTIFEDTNVYAQKGGMATMDKSFTAGVVLVMSIWDDHAANMLWLDSNYPVGADPTKPGIARGTCADTSGKPSDVETNNANASVTFSNVRFGDIGSTYSGTAVTPSSTTSVRTTTTTRATTSATSSAPTATTPASGTVPRYGQCGGQGYNGPKVCVSPYTCTASSQYYSQCL